jgi:hypothetical protein
MWRSRTGLVSEWKLGPTSENGDSENGEKTKKKQKRVKNGGRKHKWNTAMTA